ncbi:MAG: response regulator [Chloroflexia bacterium]|nr:response regulator [Chloroflexia bacterium]
MSETSRILVVDDEAAICEICTRGLQRYGYNVISTTSSLKALDIMHREEFDLLLLDIRMPEVDGLEVMRQVRKFSLDLAIVVMTGYASLEAAIEAVKQGASDFISKPFTLDNLRLAVSGALAKRDLARERARCRTLIHLAQASEELASSLNPEALVRSALQTAMAETGAHRGSVMLHEPGRDILRLMGGEGLPSEVSQGYSVSWDEGVVGLVMRSGKSLLVENIGEDPRLEGVNLARRDQYTNSSFLAVPIRGGGKVLGVLSLSEKYGEGRFQNSDMEAAGLLCNQLAIALEKARLFEEIQESYKRLQEVDRMKSEFINIAAHELRTPLSIIMGYSMMLRDELSDSQKEQAKAIVDSTFQLSRLVDDMTNLRYLEAGEVSLTTQCLYLQDVIPEVVDRCRRLAESKRQDIYFVVSADLPPVSADREKLELILSNLISNATKFTPQDQQVCIRAEAHDRVALVVVEDTGPGIPTEEWEHIFEPFYQVEDSLRREHSGMGLGLPIARELVHLHRGKIWVESQVGQGSQFFFTLPLYKLDAVQEEV